MSVPRHLELGPGVVPATVPGVRGTLAALIGTPPVGVTRRAPVLCVPGYTGSKEDFIHLLPLLAQAGHPVTAIDLRGQFESFGPDDPDDYALPALAQDIALLLRTQGPRHVIGHSFGGLICREAILAGAPALSLTLLASGPAALGGTRAALIELMRPMLSDGGVPAVFEASEALDAGDPKKAALHSDIKEFLQRRFLASPAASYLGMGSSLVSATDRTDELRATSIPTLVMYGTADDAWTPAEQGDMADRLGAVHHVFDGVGHSPAVEQPAAVAAKLEKFWSGIASSAS